MSARVDYIDYFSYLAQSMTTLLNGVLKDNGGLFRRSPQVVFGVPVTPVSGDFHLYIVGKSGLDHEKGTFLSEADNDKFLVFRNPTRLTVSFRLVGLNLPSSATLRAYDKLCAFFFDSKTIDPFLPDSLHKAPALFERLRACKAEIRMRELSLDSPAMPREEFQFHFDYLALYHSGNALREEHKTKQRVIDLNDSTERNVQ